MRRLLAALFLFAPVLDEQAYFDSLRLEVAPYELRFDMYARGGYFYTYTNSDGTSGQGIVMEKFIESDKRARLIFAHEYAHLWQHSHGIPMDEHRANKFAYCLSTVQLPEYTQAEFGGCEVYRFLAGLPTDVKPW